jgi:hypothetical protein
LKRSSFRFTCDNCHARNGSKRKENRFSAKRLPTTKLGTYIENRVNNFLRKKEAEAGEVHIRVVYSGEKMVEVKPGMKKRYAHVHSIILALNPLDHALPPVAFLSNNVDVSRLDSWTRAR